MVTTLFINSADFRKYAMFQIPFGTEAVQDYDYNLGTNAINTNIYADSLSTIEMGITIKKKAGWIFCVRNVSQTVQYGILIDNEFNCYFRYANSSVLMSNISFNTPLIIKIDKNSVFINGEKKAEATLSDFIFNYPIVFNAINTNGTLEFNGNISAVNYLKIIGRDKKVVFDCVPVKDINNNIYIYERKKGIKLSLLSDNK